MASTVTIGISIKHRRTQRKRGAALASSRMINHTTFRRALSRVCRVRVAQVCVYWLLTLFDRSNRQIKCVENSFFHFDAGTQALVRSGSPNSSLSADDGHGSNLPICRAIAVVDSATFSFETDALRFKVCMLLLLLCCAQ